MENSLNNKKNFSIVNSMSMSNRVKFNNQSYNVMSFTLQKDKSSGYGFTVVGYCPCHIDNLIDDSSAERSGLQQSDLIMKINNINCCRATLKTVLSLIKNSVSELNITVYRSTNANRSSRSNSSKLSQPMAKKAKKTSYLGKLFRPSKWLSCAAPLNLTSANSCSRIQQQTMDCTYYSKPSLSKESSQSSQIGADTGYETLSTQQSDADDSNDYTIETVTDTINSYSDCDVTHSQHSIKEQLSKQQRHGEQRFDEQKTQLIGDLIEMEANFVSYVSMAVAQLARPLRGFFMQQQDYFVLFQNIEKILIISENFLRSMDKWSAMDLYTRIGQLYTQKLNLFREAFTTYAKGHAKSKCLLEDLKSHSKQFRLFLGETQSGNLTLSNLIDLPLIHIYDTLAYFKQIRRFTVESKRNPAEAPHIDSVIFELRKILNNSKMSVEELQQENFVECDEDESESYEDTCFGQEDFSTNSLFMSTTINDVTLTCIDSMQSNDYMRASKRSLSTSSDESTTDLFYSTNSN